MSCLIGTHSNEPVPSDCSNVDLMPRRIKADYLQVLGHKANSFTQTHNFSFFVHFYSIRKRLQQQVQSVQESSVDKNHNENWSCNEGFVSGIHVILDSGFHVLRHLVSLQFNTFQWQLFSNRGRINPFQIGLKMAMQNKEKNTNLYIKWSRLAISPKKLF